MRSCSPVIVGLSLSLGYVLGGLPLFPYLIADRLGGGIYWSFGGLSGVTVGFWVLSRTLF